MAWTHLAVKPDLKGHEAVDHLHLSPQHEHSWVLLYLLTEYGPNPYWGVMQWMVYVLCNGWSMCYLTSSILKSSKFWNTSSPKGFRSGSGLFDENDDDKDTLSDTAWVQTIVAQPIQGSPSSMTMKSSTSPGGWEHRINVKFFSRNERAAMFLTHLGSGGENHTG